MTVLTDKPEVGQTNVALLAEELTEIYSTPTPKGWLEQKKVNDLYIGLIVSYNSRGLVFIPGAQKRILLEYDSVQFLV